MEKITLEPTEKSLVEKFFKIVIGFSVYYGSEEVTVL